MAQESPNALFVGISVLRSLATVQRPRLDGSHTGPGHGKLAVVLEHLEREGIKSLGQSRELLSSYIADMSGVDAALLTRNDALAYWLNLYNAGALELAAKADEAEAGSVLRVPGGFSKPYVEVGGEALSLEAIEHAKIRRFKDPRIHGALVCGSISCPTLRAEPYVAASLDADLADQMRVFLEGGGAAVAGTKVMLSRVFLWYGADFVRAPRMPTFIPASKKAVGQSLAEWLPGDIASMLQQGAPIEYQPYDWGLRCSVG